MLGVILELFVEVLKGGGVHAQEIAVAVGLCHVDGVDAKIRGTHAAIAIL